MSGNITERAVAEAGTKGKLIRVCMEFARRDGRWKAIGAPASFTTPQGTRWKQTVQRTRSLLEVDVEKQIAEMEPSP